MDLQTLYLVKNSDSDILFKISFFISTVNLLQPLELNNYIFSLYLDIFYINSCLSRDNIYRFLTKRLLTLPLVKLTFISRFNCCNDVDKTIFFVFIS